MKYFQSLQMLENSIKIWEIYLEKNTTSTIETLCVSFSPWKEDAISQIWIALFLRSVLLLIHVYIP